jgi:hypothetical protein
MWRSFAKSTGHDVERQIGRVKLRRAHRREAQRLRRVVDCLPYDTRVAMLDGMRRYDRIIVGAYTDRTGGVCPMLAAHRCGGRTSFISFARAWDRFARAKRARTATARELRALEAHLTASILAERGDPDLGGAIAEHQALVRGRKADEARRLGLGWLRRRDDARDEELV